MKFLHCWNARVRFYCDTFRFFLSISFFFFCSLSVPISFSPSVSLFLLLRMLFILILNHHLVLLKANNVDCHKLKADKPCACMCRCVHRLVCRLQLATQLLYEMHYDWFEKRLKMCKHLNMTLSFIKRMFPILFKIKPIISITRIIFILLFLLRFIFTPSIVRDFFFFSFFVFTHQYTMQNTHWCIHQATHKRNS